MIIIGTQKPNLHCQAYYDNPQFMPQSQRHGDGAKGGTCGTSEVAITVSQGRLAEPPVKYVEDQGMKPPEAENAYLVYLVYTAYE